MIAHRRTCHIRKLEKDGTQPEVTLPRASQGAFLICKVNSVKCQTFWDTGAQATIISDILYHLIGSCTEKTDKEKQQRLQKRKTTYHTNQNSK